MNSSPGAHSADYQVVSADVGKFPRFVRRLSDLAGRGFSAERISSVDGWLSYEPCAGLHVECTYIPRKGTWYLRAVFTGTGELLAAMFAVVVDSAEPGSLECYDKSTPQTSQTARPHHKLVTAA